MNYDRDVDADEQSNWYDISAKNVDSLDSDVPFTSEDGLSHSSTSGPELICTKQNGSRGGSRKKSDSCNRCWSNEALHS